MWLKNAINYTRIINGARYTSTINSLSPWGGLVKTDGTAINSMGLEGYDRPANILQYSMEAAIHLPTDSLPKFSSCVYFGNGTTPVTENDYTLASPLKAGFTYVAVSVSDAFSNLGADRRTTVLFSARNTSGESQTISEVGLGEGFPAYYNHSGYPILVYREVLATPLVVANDDIFTIRIDAEFHVG